MSKTQVYLSLDGIVAQTGVGSHTQQLLVIKLKLQYTALKVSRWWPEVTAGPLRPSSPRIHFCDGVKLSELYFGPHLQ